MKLWHKDLVPVLPRKQIVKIAERLKQDEKE
jgi:hypothetical protein